MSLPHITFRRLASQYNVNFGPVVHMAKLSMSFRLLIIFGLTLGARICIFVLFLMFEFLKPVYRLFCKVLYHLKYIILM